MEDPSGMQNSDWIALGAAVLALVALIVSIYVAVSNKPRLRISAHYALTPDLGDRLLLVVVVNHGHQPTMITHLSVVTEGRKSTIGISSPEGSVLPHLLDVGRIAEFSVPLNVQSADPFNTGQSETLGQVFAQGKSRLMIRDAWHNKPHYVSVS